MGMHWMLGILRYLPKAFSWLLVFVAFKQSQRSAIAVVNANGWAAAFKQSLWSATAVNANGWVASSICFQAETTVRYDSQRGRLGVFELCCYQGKSMVRYGGGPRERLGGCFQTESMVRYGGGQR